MKHTKKINFLKLSTAFLLGTSGLGLGTDVLATEVTSTTATTPAQLTIETPDLPVNPGDQPIPDIPGGHTTPIPEGTQFGLLFVPTSFNFGSSGKDFSLGGTITKQLTQDQYVGVGDTRQDAPGWTLTAQASTLSHDTTSLPGTISMNTAVKHVSYTQDNYQLDATIPEQLTSQAPQTSGKTSLTLGGGSQEIMSAKSGTGTGMWAVDLSTVTLAVTAPGNSQAVGDYAGTITWDLGNAPTGK